MISADSEALVALEKAWRSQRPPEAELLRASRVADEESLGRAAQPFLGAGSFEDVTGAKSMLRLSGGRFVWAVDDDFATLDDFAPPEGLVEALGRRRPERLCLGTTVPVERHIEYLSRVGALTSLTHLRVGQMGLSAQGKAVAIPPRLRGLRGNPSALADWLSGGLRLHALSLFGPAPFRALQNVQATHLVLRNTGLSADQVLAHLPKPLLSTVQSLHLEEWGVGLSPKGLRKQLKKASALEVLHLGDLRPSPSLERELLELKVVRWTQHGPYEDVARRIALFGFVE